MKTILALLITFTFSQTLWADGFVCHTADGELDVKVYNKILPEEGTRNAAVMILSNPSVSFGRKTVATFTADEGTLSNTGSKYFARVDERFNNIPKGEYLQSTRLDYLKTIIVDIDFSYNNPSLHQDTTEGWMILIKENGAPIKSKLLCERYLKN